jgi:hypothetical protein
MSNDRMVLVNDKLGRKECGRIWKEEILFYFEAVYRYSRGNSEKSHEKSQGG